MPTVAPVTRIVLKTILVPTDFSAASRAALPFARILAQIYESSLLLAHAIAATPHPQVVTDTVPAERAEARQEARKRLDEFKRGPSLADLPAKQLIEQGDLAEVIPAMILQHGVDLVVLGTHGRTGVSKVFLGSGAEKIYRTASCPVLTVGPKARAKDWKLRRILCPLDVEGNPEPALYYALSLAEENQSEFIVLQAIPMVPWQHRPALELQSQKHLESLIPEQARDWCTPHFLIRWEHPAEAILQAAREREADLIVMGVRKARAAGLSSHLPWPVASEVVSSAPCPVLTVRV